MLGLASDFECVGDDGFPPVASSLFCGPVVRASAGSLRQSSIAFDALPFMAFLERDGLILQANRKLELRCGHVRRLTPVQSLLGAGSGTDASSQEMQLQRRVLTAESRRGIEVDVYRSATSRDGLPCTLWVFVEVSSTPESPAELMRSPLLRQLLDATPEATVVASNGRILCINREFTRMFGYEQDACVGEDLDSLVVPDGRIHESDMMMHSLSTNGRSSVETVRRTSSGELMDVLVLVAELRLGEEDSGILVTYRDIRRQKKEQERLQHDAFHDALTGLPNRAFFLDRVQRMMSRLARRPDRPFAVVFVDLDGFKKVNDTLGHAAGDALLLQIAERMQRCLRPQDVVARFGGDEFALLLDDSGDELTVGSVADRMQCEIQREVTLGDGRAHVAASMGIVLAGTGHSSAEQILHQADTAMYCAKEAGKARKVFYRPAAASRGPVLGFQHGSEESSGRHERQRAGEANASAA